MSHCSGRKKSSRTSIKRYYICISVLVLLGLKDSQLFCSSVAVNSGLAIGGVRDVACAIISHEHTQQELSHDSIALLNCALPITKIRAVA